MLRSFERRGSEKDLTAPFLPETSSEHQNATNRLMASKESHKSEVKP